MNRTKRTSPPAPSSASAHVVEYGIDELARVAGTTVRNVRSYQDRGLIPPPRLRGRVGIYSDIHLARLHIISDLLSRGYSLANIAELLLAWEKGRDIDSVIGVETVLASPWTNEIALTVPAAEFAELFDIEANDLQRLQALGYVVKDGKDFRILSPRLLHAIAGIIRAGVPLNMLLDLVGPMRIEVDRIADSIARLVIESLIDPFGKDSLPPASELPRLTEAVRSLRPLTESFVSAELVRALELAATRHLGDRLVTALAPGLASTPDVEPAVKKRKLNPDRS